MSDRSCNVSDVLADLVRAAAPLADKQKRFLKFSDDSNLLEVVVEESALQQARATSLKELFVGLILTSKLKLLPLGLLPVACS